MSAFAVALKAPDLPPLAPAAFLAGGGGFTADSAREFLLRQPGFLGRGLTLPAARELAAAAAAAGFGTVIADERDIPRLPPPLTVAKADPKAGGFYAQAGGAVKFIPYETITLFSAGAFDLPLPRSDAGAIHNTLLAKLREAFSGPGPWTAAASAPEPRETFFRADILAEDGALHLLLAPETLDFSPLGPARSFSSLANFRALLDIISASSFNALKNAFVRAFLEGAALTPLKLSGPDACETELSRLLLIRPQNFCCKPQSHYL